MSSARQYFICPVEPCGWQFGWNFTPPKPDPDPGLFIAMHMELVHPQLVYGESIPSSVVARILATHASGLSAPAVL